MRKLITGVVVIASSLFSLLLSAVITFAASEHEPAVFRPSPNSTPSLNPSVSYYVYDERYNPFVSEIEGAVRNVLKFNWMLPSPLVIELGRPTFQCPQDVIAYFCRDNGRGYSYINFMPAFLEGNITYRYDTYYHELGHAVAEAHRLFLRGDPCIDENTYGQWQPWACQWNEGFAEFFSANFMNRNQSVFRVEDEQSPAFVANTMLEKVSEGGWDFFLCLYDKAVKSIALGYWERSDWELAVEVCSLPPFYASFEAPSVVRVGETFEVVLFIEPTRPMKGLMLNILIPSSSFELVNGKLRAGWLDLRGDEILETRFVLRGLVEGTFTLGADITWTTAIGAQGPLHFETTVTVLSPTPKFSLLKATLSTSEVRPGQEVFVSIQIQNTGQTSGTVSLRLRSNGTLIVEDSRFLLSGEVWDVKYAVKFNTAGTYTITMDADPIPITIGQVSVQEPSLPPPPPPSGGIVISIEATATRVVPSQEIIVRARVINNGTSLVTIPVPFMVDGKPITTSNLTIAPGETETLEFKISFSSDQTGTHTIVVGNSLPITIYVEEPESNKTPEQFFDSNANGRLDDLEILTALDYWIKQRPVPDIGVLSELQILALLDKWIKGTRIAGR